MVSPLALGVVVNCAWMILRTLWTYIKPMDLGRSGIEDRADCLEAQTVVAHFLLNTVATHYEALA